MVHQVTTSDNERYNKWQQVVQRVTTNENEWERMTTSGTTNGNEWQRVVQRVVQRVTMSGTTSESKWEWYYVSEWNNYAM